MRTQTNVRCRDCGTWTKAVRCPICEKHYTLRKRYDNPLQKKRSTYLTKEARRDKRNARHCMRCHRLRRRQDFLIFSNPLSICVMCRDEEFSKGQKVQSTKRLDAQISKKVGL